MNLNFNDVLSYFNNAKAKAVKSTAFQESPFSETIKIDPYKTNKLGILSEAELAISRYINDIGKILPLGFLDKLKGNADILSLLKDSNLDLDSLLKQVSSMLPGHINLTDLLASCDLKNIFNNLGSIFNVLDSLHINLNDISSHFLIDCLNYLAKLTGFNFDISSFTKFFNKKDGSSQSVVNNKAAFVAVTLASIKQSSKLALTTNLTLQGLGITKKLLPNTTHLINNSTYKSLTSLNNILTNNVNTNINICLSSYNQITGLKNKDLLSILKMDVSISIATKQSINNIASTLTYNPFMDLTDCVKTNNTNATSSLFSLIMNNVGLVTNINSILKSIPLSDINRVIQILLTIDFITLFGVLNEIKNTSVQDYIIAHGNTYPDLFDVVNLYSADIIIFLAIILENNNIANINNVVSLINIIGIDNTDKLLSQYNNSTANNTLIAIQTLESFNTGDLIAVQASIKIVGLINYPHVLTIEENINSLSLEDFVNIVNLNPIDTLNNDIFDSIRNLNTNQLNFLFSIVNDNDITKQLNDLEIHGIFFDYTIIQSAEIYAQSSQYQKLFLLFNQYSEIFSNYYIHYLYKTLLKNFKFSSDDYNLGIERVSNFIIHQFNIYSSDWLYSNNNSLEYSELKMFEHLSEDSKSLLMSNQITLIPLFIKENIN